ncbi:MAG: Hsp20/alpha crystallin family protein [Chlorobiales bacterium]
MNKQSKDDSTTGLGGVWGAIEKLAKLAEDLQNAKGELNREGEVDLGKNAKASYRFRVRTLGDVKRESSKSDFKPFEKSAPPKATKSASVNLPKRTLAEPETDVFIEGDVVVIYVQLSGVSESDISINAYPDRLVLRAENASFLYQKDLPLPARIQPESLFKSYKNGILEVRLTIQPNA